MVDDYFALRGGGNTKASHPVKLLLSYIFYWNGHSTYILNAQSKDVNRMIIQDEQNTCMMKAYY